MDGIRILLVEDDPAVQALVAAFFETAEGMELVGTAADGVEGLEAIRALAPDLVLLDLVMPRLSGMGLLRALAAEPAEKKPKVPVISRVNSQEIIEKALEHGAHFYLLKPVNLLELPGLIADLCSGGEEGPAGRLLHAMGAKGCGREFRCVRLVAEALAAAPEGALLLKTAYYTAVEAEGIDYICVEKNVRTMAQKLFDAETPAWRALWGRPLERRPSNGVFLRALARRLREAGETGGETT